MEIRILPWAWVNACVHIQVCGIYLGCDRLAVFLTSNLRLPLVYGCYGHKSKIMNLFKYTNIFSLLLHQYQVLWSSTLTVYLEGTKFQSWIYGQQSKLRFFIVSLVPTRFIYLFMVYFNGDAISSDFWLQIIGWRVNWEGYGRKKLWHNVRYCPGICLEGLRKTIINPGYLSISQDLN